MQQADGTEACLTHGARLRAGRDNPEKIRGLSSRSGRILARPPFPGAEVQRVGPAGFKSTEPRSVPAGSGFMGTEPAEAGAHGASSKTAEAPVLSLEKRPVSY